MNGAFDRATRDATTLTTNPGQLDEDSILWRLRDPGYFREICDHPIAAPRTWVMMLPVLVAWLFIGGAELWYRITLSGESASASEGFFAAWTRAPIVLSPVAMAVAVVVAIVIISVQYARHARAQRRADRIDEVAQRLEADIGPAVDALLRALPAIESDEATRDAARNLAAAAQQFSAAAGALDRSMAGLRRFAEISEQLTTVVPAVGQQIEKLHATGRELLQAAELVSEEGDALKTAVNTTFSASSSAESAQSAAAESAVRTAEAARRVDAVEESIQAKSELITIANAPFTSALSAVSDTAETLREVVDVVRTVAASLNAAVEQANWIALVADGLQHPQERMNTPEPEESNR
ncbi:hypothetical protein AB0L82_36295 [Nocardia sp. NPDC052001]|uniref:hypothetical protein n=1 Tax=Nocardia sp. NPDC052001 TaxID=3154853 RepID=UPI003422FC26